jgi:hypothetical protein
MPSRGPVDDRGRSTRIVVQWPLWPGVPEARRRAGVGAVGQQAP